MLFSQDSVRHARFALTRVISYLIIARRWIIKASYLTDNRVLLWNNQPILGLERNE